jgi:hypothetical protein
MRVEHHCGLDIVVYIVVYIYTIVEVTGNGSTDIRMIFGWFSQPFLGYFAAIQATLRLSGMKGWEY